MKDLAEANVSGRDVESIVVRGGRVVDPSQDLDRVLDVLLEGGEVARLEERIEAPEARQIDATGLVVTPGLIDMHVHLREPGQEYQETIASGVRAAAAGGFTAVACMANTQPVNDHRAVTELILNQARRHPQARVYPIGAISQGLRGEELAEIGDMLQAGAVAISDDGVSVKNGAFLRRALQYARHFEIPLIQPLEDLELAADGVMHEGEHSTRLGLPGLPGLAEDARLSRDLLLVEDTDGRYHVAHLSTARSLGMVRDAKRQGLAVTCQVTPHHLLLTDREVVDRGFSAATKVKPPLRSQADVSALLEGLVDGTIDAIASGHAPHHPDEKDVQFSAAPFGVGGLETTVSVCLDRLVAPGHVDLSRWVELLSTGPAKVLGIPGGSLEPGQPADLTLLDLERQVTVQATAFYSKSRHTPFEGWQLQGAAVGTIVGGQPINLGNKD